MKKLLKLTFFAIIAGVTWKYLTDKDIEVTGLFSSALEWTESKAGQIEHFIKSSEFGETTDNDNRSSADQRVTGDFGNVPEPSRRQNNSRPEYSFSSSQPPLASRSDADNSEAEEYPVAEKQFPGTERFPELDRYAQSSPEQAEATMQTLAEWLSGHASGELEKARLLFTWVATHVAYDDNGFNTGNYSDTSPEGVFKNRVSVCQGYSELFTALCKLAGLEAVTINGYAKGITYSPGSRFYQTNHAWNAVRIEGEWKLFDVTWAAGYGRGLNGTLVSTMEFDDYWFNTSPEEFIFSHMPEESQWQLTPAIISKEQFEAMPYIHNSFFRLGFGGAGLLSEVLNGYHIEVPESYKVGGQVKALSLPSGRRIASDKPLRIRLRSAEAADIAVINNGDWIHLIKTGNDFTAVIMPRSGQLSINVRFNPAMTEYSTMLSYLVE
jgi:transglutaminase-like putative cysteine protease